MTTWIQTYRRILLFGCYTEPEKTGSVSPPSSVSMFTEAG